MRHWTILLAVGAIVAAGWAILPHAGAQDPKKPKANPDVRAIGLAIAKQFAGSDN